MSQLRALFEGAVGLLQGLDGAQHLADRGFGESTPNAADIDELAIHILAEQQGAERVAAATLAGRVAAHHKLGGLVRLDLHPLRRADSRLVGAVQSLPDDPFETQLERMPIELVAVFLEGLQDPDRAFGRLDAGEATAALPVGELPQVI